MHHSSQHFVHPTNQAMTLHRTPHQPAASMLRQARPGPAHPQAAAAAVRGKHHRCRLARAAKCCARLPLRSMRPRLQARRHRGSRARPPPRARRSHPQPSWLLPPSKRSVCGSRPIDRGTRFSDPKACRAFTAPAATAGSSSRPHRTAASAHDVSWPHLRLVLLGRRLRLTRSTCATGHSEYSQGYSEYSHGFRCACAVRKRIDYSALAGVLEVHTGVPLCMRELDPH